MSDVYLFPPKWEIGNASVFEAKPYDSNIDLTQFLYFSVPEVPPDFFETGEESGNINIFKYDFEVSIRSATTGLSVLVNESRENVRVQYRHYGVESFAEKEVYKISVNPLDICGTRIGYEDTRGWELNEIYNFQIRYRNLYTNEVSEWSRMLPLLAGRKPEVIVTPFQDSRQSSSILESQVKLLNAIGYRPSGYRFSLYDENTGQMLEESKIIRSYSDEASYIFRTLLENDFGGIGQYKLYRVKTTIYLNDNQEELVQYSTFSFTGDNVRNQSNKIEINVTPLNEEGAVLLNMNFLDDTFSNGTFEIIRKEKGTSYGTLIKRFRLSKDAKIINIYDLLVEDSKEYVYNFYYLPINKTRNLIAIGDKVDFHAQVHFEYVFLLGYLNGQLRQLKLPYSTKQTNVRQRSAKVYQETLSAKYPKGFNNKVLNYRSFNLESLLSVNSDPMFLFTLDKQASKVFSETLVGHRDDRTSGSIENHLGVDDNRPLQTNYGYEIIYDEREFRELVFEFITQVNHFIYKTPHEKTMIVGVGEPNYTPNTTISNLIGTLTFPCTELDDYNAENLREYGFTPKFLETTRFSADMVNPDKDKKNPINMNISDDAPTTPGGGNSEIGNGDSGSEEEREIQTTEHYFEFQTYLSNMGERTSFNLLRMIQDSIEQDLLYDKIYKEVVWVNGFTIPEAPIGGSITLNQNTVITIPPSGNFTYPLIARIYQLLFSSNTLGNFHIRISYSIQQREATDEEYQDYHSTQGDPFINIEPRPFYIQKILNLDDFNTVDYYSTEEINQMLVNDEVTDKMLKDISRGVPIDKVLTKKKGRLLTDNHLWNIIHDLPILKEKQDLEVTETENNNLFVNAGINYGRNYLGNAYIYGMAFTQIEANPGAVFEIGTLKSAITGEVVYTEMVMGPTGMLVLQDVFVREIRLKTPSYVWIGGVGLFVDDPTGVKRANKERLEKEKGNISEQKIKATHAQSSSNHEEYSDIKEIILNPLAKKEWRSADKDKNPNIVIGFESSYISKIEITTTTDITSIEVGRSKEFILNSIDTENGIYKYSIPINWSNPLKSLSCFFILNDKKENVGITNIQIYGYPAELLEGVIQ